MAMDKDDPHQWFTAGEVAEVAKARGIGEVPTTKSGMIKWIKRRVSESPYEWRSLSRVRPGQKGGGGTEYHWHLFSGYRTKQLAKALEDEAFRRGPDMDRERRGWKILARLAWECNRQPGEVSFSPDDQELMWDLLPADPQVRRVMHVKRMKVRRHRVAGTYEAWELRAFEGKWVVVVWCGYEWNRWAIIWRYNEFTRELERHGKDGVICVIEPPPPPQGLDWDIMAERGDVPPLSPEVRLMMKRIISRS